MPNVAVLEKEPARQTNGLTDSIPQRNWPFSLPFTRVSVIISGCVERSSRDHQHQHYMFSVNTIHHLGKCQKSRFLGPAQTSWIGNSRGWAQPSEFEWLFLGILMHKHESHWLMRCETWMKWFPRLWSHPNHLTLLSPGSSTLGPGSANTSMDPTTTVPAHGGTALPNLLLMR